MYYFVCFLLLLGFVFFFFFKQKTAYEMRISDWSSDVCSSDLVLIIAAHLRHRLVDPGVVERVGDRVVPLGPDALAEHHRHPARGRKQLEIVAEDAALLAEQGDLAREAVGRLHRPAIIPERRIVAPRRVEMEDDEIADIDRKSTRLTSGH